MSSVWSALSAVLFSLFLASSCYSQSSLQKFSLAKTIVIIQGQESCRFIAVSIIIIIIVIIIIIIIIIIIVIIIIIIIIIIMTLLDNTIAGRTSSSHVTNVIMRS